MRNSRDAVIGTTFAKIASAYRAKRATGSHLSTSFTASWNNHISQKNIDRVGLLVQHSDPEVRSLAELVQDIARVKPYQRRRLRFLAQKQRNLLLRLVEAYGGDLPDKLGPWPLDDYE